MKCMYTILQYLQIDALEKENKLLRDQSDDKSYLESDLEKDITLVEGTCTMYSSCHMLNAVKNNF